MFCLLRPTLILRAAVPQQNFLGILIDDSRSMTIADTDGKPRTDFVQQQLQPKTPLLEALSGEVRPALLPFLGVGRSAWRAGRAEIRRDGEPPRPRARASQGRTGRPAARRARDGQRRRGHLRPVARRAAGLAQGAVHPGLHGRRRPGAVRARHPDLARRDAADDPQGHLARRRRGDQPHRVRRPAGAARRRRRGAARQRAGRHASARRRVGHRPRQLHHRGRRREAVPVPCGAAGRRAGRAEQRARRARRGHRGAREGAVPRRRAAVRSEVHPPRGRRRQEPAGRHPAADGGGKVPPAGRRQP